MGLFRFIILYSCLMFLAVPSVNAGTIPGPVIPAGLGVNIHFTSPRPGEMRMLAAAGFKWVRMDFLWADTEKHKGIYTFGAYDHLLKRLKAYHIRAYLILDYGNPLYNHMLPPTSPAARRAFCRWVAAAVRHFKGQGVIWELWNEPNGGFWKPRPDARAYAQLAVAVGRAIRRVNPRAIYVGPALSGVLNLGFLKTCFKAGVLRYWNAVSVHPYIGYNRSNVGPEGVIPHYAAIRRLISRYEPAGRHIPVLSGEWGYSSAWYPGHPGRQARYAVRELLINLYQHIPISMYYDWHDDGPNPRARESNFGLVHYGYYPGHPQVYKPKQAYLACHTLCRLLQGFHFDKRLKLPVPNEYLLAFANGHRRRWVIWSTVKSEPGMCHAILPVPPGAYRLVNDLGTRQMRVHAGPTGLNIRISTGPQYVIPWHQQTTNR